MKGYLKHRQVAREMFRDDLLDVASNLLATGSWSSITMEMIASGAGISRQTLYNEFGSRDALAQSLVLRETERFLILVEQALRSRPDDPYAAVESAFVTIIEVALDNPMVRSIVARDPGADDLLALFTTRGLRVVELCTGRLAQVAAELWSADDYDRVSFAAEAMTRLAISHVALPTRPTTETATLLAAMVAPFLSSEPDWINGRSTSFIGPAVGA